MSRSVFLLKNILIVAVFSAATFALFFIGVQDVFAQTESLEVVGDAAEVSDADLFQVIGTIINVFFGFLGIIFLILVIYAGFLWMTAAGNGEKVDKAKQILIQATIGLVITLSAFAITTFIMNALRDAGLLGSGSGTDDSPVEVLSGSLGNGVIKDHYPERNATDIARNTKIFVTFKDQMNIESFIDGYDTNGTPDDVSDDIVATELLASNVQIYATADGSDAALTGADVSVTFTEDLKTFVFDPPVLGSATEDTNYTVALSDNIENIFGQTPLNLGGYQWTFTVGTELDLTPPEVQSVIPINGLEYDRNIIVQMNFNEAIDPTASTGSTGNGFENIQVRDGGLVVSGTYEISNGYKTITFTPEDACGTNSCGETIFCLPGNASLDARIFAATPGEEPPQVDDFPYDGIVDVAANALDGDGDWGTEEGEVGDHYDWAWTTTDDVNLSSPEIDTVVPEVLQPDIDLDQPIIVTFGCMETVNPAACDSILMSSTVSSENILIESDPDHEMWYNVSRVELTDTGEEVDDEADIPVQTQITVKHGIFLESTDEQTYVYQPRITNGIRNQYQNCFVPGEGPNASGARCGTSESEPYCCSGSPSSTICPEI